MILSVSISRITGFISEAQCVKVAHNYTKVEVKKEKMEYPVHQMTSMLTLWSIEEISFEVYFIFLVWLLLIIEGETKKIIERKVKKEKAEDDRNYVQ